ncbi:hypothetical protein C0989_005035, partial [Termitomyces sp. Mn162]
MDQYNRQKQFSNHLKLLSIANYQDPYSKWSGAKDRYPSTAAKLHVLDTIAFCMATGAKGDVVASAFSVNSKGQKVILLAKNTDPKGPALDDGPTLIRLMQNSPNHSMLDILPFIATRGAKHVQDHLQKFFCLMEEHRKQLEKKIQSYEAEPVVVFDSSGELVALLNSEFPEIDQEFLLMLGGSSRKGPQSTLKVILREIVKTCGETPLRFDTTMDSQKKFRFLVNAATALGSSKFFHRIMEKEGASITGGKKWEKLWRNLNKMRQYVRISDASSYLQKNGPFIVEWVTEAELGNAANSEFKKIPLDNVWITIKSIGLGSNKQELDPQNAISHLRDMNRYWDENIM